MKRIYILLTTWALCLLGGCSEDALVPGSTTHNFAPDADAQDKESVLRREFFGKYDCYLVFNDTLRHEYVGTDDDGDPYYNTELVDPAWLFTGVESNVEYHFGYVKTIEEKKACYDFLSDVMELIKEHGLPKPYSILAVNNIQKVDDQGMLYTYDQLITFRCFIINCLKYANTDEAKYRVIVGLATKSLMSKCATELKEFFDLTVPPGGYIPQHGRGKPWFDYENENILDYYDRGFLERNPGEETWPSQEEDVAAYLYLLLTETQEEVEHEFRGKDVILRKYELFREIAKQYGILY